MVKSTKETTGKTPGPMKVKQARYLSVINLASLALSAVFFLSGIKFAGLAMLFAAIFSFVLLISTGVYRIAGGNPLDEIETEQMQKAYAWSYWVLGTGLILAVLLLQLSDRLAVMMQSEDVHEFLFWAFTSIILVLPAAALSWKMPV